MRKDIPDELGLTEEAENLESLGDVNRIIRVTDDGKVENFFASEDYRTCIERTIDFYNNDLIHKDAATGQDGADQQCAKETHGDGPRPLKKS